MSKNPREPESATDSPAPPATRRGFVAAAAVVAGSVALLGPLLMGLWAFIDPLTRRRTKPLAFRGGSKGPEGYVRIAPAESLTAGEPPQRFVVIDDKRDSWNFMPNQPVGAIFIQKTGDEKLLVFNATCPHLGCSVSWNGQYFHCPCHNSSFDPDGSKRVTQSGRENPSPRDLDMLQHEVIDGQIWVKYQDFYTGRPTPIPKT